MINSDIPSVPIRISTSQRQISIQNNRNPEARLQKWLQRLERHWCRQYLSRHRLATLAQLLSNLNHVEDSGDGWSARCPAHADTKPSLSVNVDKSSGRFLIHCFRGCKFETIVLESRMLMSEMFETTSSPRPPFAPPTRRLNLTPRISEHVPSAEERQKVYALAVTQCKIQELADVLGVKTSALQSIGIGWYEHEECWTFPEFNGQQQICGILRRFKTGVKKAIKGGHRGLTLPQNWKESTGTLHICEGPTDVAAAISSGLRAIGRPGIRSGLGDLATLLRSEKQQLVVVADNDAEGQGREGAEELAKQLASILEKRVDVMAPPKGFKDLRDYLTGRAS